jgi:hypothetical protein
MFELHFKMMKNPTTLLLFACIFLNACNNASSDKTADRKDGYSAAPKTKVDSLFEDIGQAHDFGMSNMHKLHGLQKSLGHFLDSINSATTPLSEHSKAYVQSMIAARDELNKADTAMNKWMEDFVPDSAENNMDPRIKYLESEKEKVVKVKELLSTSINRADSLLKSNH